MADNYLGIDPSTVASGYGIINSNGELIDWGVVKPNKRKLNEAQQAAFQYAAFTELITKYNIKGIACEDQHRGPNADTLKKLSRVTGYMILLAGQHEVPIELYHPSSWRKTSLGKGNAKKEDSVNWVNEKYELLLDVKKHNDIAEGIGVCFAGMLHFTGGNEHGDKADKAG
jgi:crossover junction endodeoxyribonuclease RuvC